MQPPDDCPPGADGRARPFDELPERRLDVQALDGCPHGQACPPGGPPDLRLIRQALDFGPPDVDTGARPPGEPPDLRLSCQACVVPPPDVEAMVRPPGKPPDLSVKALVHIRSDRMRA